LAGKIAFMLYRLDTAELFRIFWFIHRLCGLQKNTIYFCGAS
jgi:hypothetical protein